MNIEYPEYPNDGVSALAQARLLVNQARAFIEGATSLTETEQSVKQWLLHAMGVFLNSPPAATVYQQRIAELESALKSVLGCGHSEDCILCGFKDRYANNALKCEVSG